MQKEKLKLEAEKLCTDFVSRSLDITTIRPRVIIGKGGMGKKTQDACKKYGCVYLSAVGGAAAVLAKSIKSVRNVYKLEFSKDDGRFIK